VLYGNSKRSGNNTVGGFGHKIQQPVQINGLKSRDSNPSQQMQAAASSTGDGFHVREANETTHMKARPSTSIRLASKSHQFGSNSQHFGVQGASQTLKFNGGRQVFNNRTMETTNGAMAQPNGNLVQMKGALGGRVGQGSSALDVGSHQHA